MGRPAASYVMLLTRPDIDVNRPAASYPKGPTTSPSGYVVGPLGYDAAGRLTSISGLVSSITYDAAGRPIQKVNASPNGAVTTWAYHPDRGFVTGIQTTS